MARETVIASFIMRFVKPAAAAATAGAGTAAGAELPACSAAGGSDSHSGAGVAAGGSGPKTGARIAVRHVQSGYERRFVNLDDAMVSTFMAHTFLVRLGFSYILAAVCAIMFAFVFGMAVERIFLRPIQGGPLISLMIMTLGLFMVLNGAAGWVWGFDPVSFPRAVSGRPIWIGDLIITRDSILVLAVTIAMALALYAVLRFTMAGIAIRATSQNSRAARLMGVPVPKVYALTWGISAVLGAVAGILIAPTTFLSPSMMAEVQIKAFTAAVLGGFSSLPGAVVGGLLLGVLENLVAGYVSTELKSTFAFALIVAVLFVRPSGLLGTPPKRKV